jgi:DNA-binding NtrC family response regulator/tetratricopeptide (TPR) repeat protein
LHASSGVRRLIHDRYFAYDELHGLDLATGAPVRLDELPDQGAGGLKASGYQASAARGDAGQGGGRVPASLIEILNDGRDGAPRWVVADARNGAQAAAMAARAAADARRRGFVPLLVPLYLRWRTALAADLDERTLLLIGGFTRGLTADRRALIQAAATSPRPHLLLTFRCAEGGRPVSVVREARAAYGGRPAPGRGRVVALPAEVVRLVERAAHAADFQRLGRHAAAERLLREVSGSLVRRQALVPAVVTHLALGRMLLERGRAAGAEKVFDEAAQLAESGEDESAIGEARIWQAAARTDAGRLTDAESTCRAVLLTGQLSPGRQAWATAMLARVLLWQGRSDEAGSCLPPGLDETADIDAVTAATVEATAVRVLLAAGEIFAAGQRARSLIAKNDAGGGGGADAAARVVALTAHLRVMAAAGDLDLAHGSLSAIAALSRQARLPFRAIRARLIWHDALRRAGRDREARHEREHLLRMRRAAPALLRRAIDQRLAAGDVGEPFVPIVPSPHGRVTSTAATLVRLVHDEEIDLRALERVATRLARDLTSTRIDLVTTDAGAVSTLMSKGAGLPTRLGARTIESGLVIGEDVEGGGHEIGVPMRLGSRLIAALVCRWPLDRQPPPHATPLLELAAAVAAPRADALLASRREASQASTRVPELIGVSAAMQEVRRAVERAAKAPFAVLIEGESGVGKELAARAVHQLSARRDRPFCDVNCAALPDDLLESELFGHVRGAFTGAVADTAGLFEGADGGTVFLDEIPDLSPRGQAKLLRVLQQQEVRRVGETFSRKVDVRLVAAANRDMRLEAGEGRFRPDLLYRIDVIRIRIPALRERPEDIAILAQQFWRASSARVACAATLTHALLAELTRYHWPGNVRELQNVMAALAVAAPARGLVRPSLLPPAITGAACVTSRRLSEARAQFERRCVEVALARASGNRTRAAAELGLSRQGLLKTMARLGLGSEVAR